MGTLEMQPSRDGVRTLYVYESQAFDLIGQDGALFRERRNNREPRLSFRTFPNDSIRFFSLHYSCPAQC